MPSDVVIIGYYGFRNLGDEAILASMLDLLREALPVGDVVVVSGDPKHTQETYGVRAVDSTDIPAVLEAVYNTAMVIVGGGGLLSDQSGFTPEHALTRQAGNIPGYLAPALAAGVRGTPIVAWGVGVGPLYYGDSRRWVKALGEMASIITVRTKEDLTELESLGVSGASVAGDLAWLVEPSSLPPDFARTLEGLPRPIVGVTPRSWGSSSLQDFREQALAEGLDSFISEHQGSVLFIPFQELEDPWDDRLCSQRIHKRMSSEKVSYAPAGLSPSQFVSTLESCDIAVNMRLHGTILAGIGGVPSISISYDPKVNRMADQLGLGDLCHPAEGLSSLGLARSLNLVWNDLDKRKRDLSDHVVAERDTVRLSLLEIRKALSQDKADLVTPGRETVAEVISNLAGKVSSVQKELDQSKQEETELRDLVTQSEGELRLVEGKLQVVEGKLQAVEGKLQVLVGKLQVTSEQYSAAQRRGDLLQLELDNLRQTRAIKLVVKYWKIRHRLRQQRHRIRQKRKPAISKADHLPSTRSTGQSIPQRVHDRIAESKGVVIFPFSIHWYINLFQRPQQLAQAFARLGYTVIYDNSRQGHEPGVEEIEPRLFLYYGVPEVLHQLPDPLVWGVTYNWDQAMSYPEGTRTVYDWIDEIDVFYGHNLSKMKKFHALALAGAGTVTATARRLLKKARVERPDAIYLPNAVDFEHFSNWQVATPAHPVLQGFLQEGRPIAGYYGAIARWLDYDLLTEVATERKDWSFLMIGPLYDGSHENRPLFSLPNVGWITAQPYQDLPRWLQSFDVAIIPFVMNEITESTSPVKLFEYFAGGKPVVSSEMPEVVAFPEVRSYSDAEGMSDALDLALADSVNPETRKGLRQRGEENSWFARIQTAVETIEQ